MGRRNLLLGHQYGKWQLTKEMDSLDILEQYGTLSCNSVCTPVSGSELSNDCTGAKFLDAAGLQKYQIIVEPPEHLAQVARYDIAITFDQLPKEYSKPATTHMATAKRILHYI